MSSIFQLLVIGILLYSQNTPVLSDFEQLTRDRLRSEYGSYAPGWMFTIIARYQDGSPIRGYISCDGHWFKFADEDQVAGSWAHPFRSDSRGAAIFNPGPYTEDEQQTCYAVTETDRSGRVTFTPHDGGVFYITVPGKGL